MRLIGFALVMALLGGPVRAQRHKLTINAETPEGQLLAQIGQESDEGRKMAMMEDFAAKYPKHEGIAWVYEQMYAAYQKAGQLDKGLATCDKLLAVDPEDARSAHGCLKIAEAKKDPDTVKTWSARGSAVARKVAASPQPKDEDEVEGWKERVDFAKQFDIYTEYSLYAAALTTPDAKKKAELLDALEQRDEKYEHLPVLREQVFRALWSANDVPGAIALADKLALKDKASEEMLLAVAENAWGRKDYDKAASFAAKVIASLPAKPKPEGISGPDWETMKEKRLASAYYLEGTAYAIQNKFAQADKTLRAGIPYLVKGNDQMLAGAYFYLGLANFRLGDSKVPDKDRILAAIKFNEQCVAIKSPFQAAAQKNIKAIRAQFQIR